MEACGAITHTKDVEIATAGNVLGTGIGVAALYANSGGTEKNGLGLRFVFISKLYPNRIL